MAYFITNECNGCTVCAKICPTQAASGEKKELHTIDAENCIECDACGKLCPQGAIKDPTGRIPEKVKRGLWQKPAFNTELCMACGLCIDVCPTNCISTGPADSKTLKAYPELAKAGDCISCGFCAEECPVDAVEMVKPEEMKGYMVRRNQKPEKKIPWGLKKMGYRTFHKMSKPAVNVLPIPIPVLLTGPGSVKTLAENIGARGLKKVLVVTDKVLMELKVLDGFLAALDENGVEYVVFDDVQPNPTIENVETGREVYKKNKCQAIVGFGGGSPIDCGKVIGARIRNPYMPVRFMKGLMKVVIPPPPFYCVPTTAGTGSETTVAAVITNAQTHEKFAINDFKLVPKIAVLDPELMAGLPPHITSTTGMDALTHAVEAYINLNGNEFTDQNAEKATRLIFENLEKAYEDGSDLKVRYDMALASFYAGAAFTRAYVGYVHAIAHNMGGLYGVPHGLANAIILPHVLDFCREAAQGRLARLAVVAGVGSENDSEEVLSIKFIEKIKEMNANMDIPTGIEQLKESDIPLIAERALKEAHPLYPVPRIMSRQECEILVSGLLV